MASAASALRVVEDHAARSGGCGASGAINGILYVYSACNAAGTLISRLDRYNPATDTWTTRAAPINKHSLPAAAVINGKFYLAGGSDGTVSAQAESYDPASNGWTALPAMPAVRMGGEGVALNGKLYVVGGFDDGGNLGSIAVYTPASNTWASATLSPLILPRAPAGGAINGLIYAVGGFDTQTGSYVGTTEAYTP